MMMALCAGPIGLAAAQAAPRPSAIDIDPASPTLGELLDREAAARPRPRAVAPPPAPEAEERPAPRPEPTGSLPAPRAHGAPPEAVTVILPHPKLQAGRPVPLGTGPR